MNFWLQQAITSQLGDIAEGGWIPDQVKVSWCHWEKKASNLLDTVIKHSVDTPDFEGENLHKIRMYWIELKLNPI